MNAITRISDKGQVVVPKSARDRLGWYPGTELEVIESSDTVTLRPKRDLGRKSIDEVIAELRKIYQHKGPPIPVEQLSWSPDVDDDELA